MSDISEKEGLAIVTEIVEKDFPVIFETSTAELWYLACALQLVATHPGLSVEMVTMIYNSANKMASVTFGFVTRAEELWEKGWDRNEDR